MAGLAIGTPESEDREHRFFGLYLGHVTACGDPQQRGRVKVRVPSVVPDQDMPTWAEPACSTWGDGNGRMIVPPVGAQVFVMFLDGDPVFPVWFPGNWKQGTVPGKATGQYPDTRTLWTDDRGVAVIEARNGSLRVDGKRRLEVDMHGGDLVVNTKTGGTGGTVKINRPGATQNAARVGDGGAGGTLEFTFGPGTGGATLVVAYTDPDGHVTTLPLGSGTVTLREKINEGSDSVLIG